MRSKLRLTATVLVVSAGAITALCVAAGFPLLVWAALIAVVVLIALVILVVLQSVSDARYTFLAGIGGGFAAAFVLLATTALAIPDDSGVFSLTLSGALAIGAGILSGRKQHQYRRNVLGVTAAAAASTLIAAVLSAVVTMVSVFVYALIACSDFVNSCPFS
jgi:hypothetical protein